MSKPKHHLLAHLSYISDIVVGNPSELYPEMPTFAETLSRLQFKGTKVDLDRAKGHVRNIETELTQLKQKFYIISNSLKF